MDYSSAHVSALLRGPLLSTPQGWVVLTSFVGYYALAGLFALALIPAPLGKAIDTAVILCLFWPFIVFLCFVKEGAPSFKPSLWQTLFVASAALAPVIYVAYRSYV